MLLARISWLDTLTKKQIGRSNNLQETNLSLFDLCDMRLDLPAQNYSDHTAVESTRTIPSCFRTRCLRGKARITERRGLRNTRAKDLLTNLLLSVAWYRYVHTNLLYDARPRLLRVLARASVAVVAASIPRSSRYVEDSAVAVIDGDILETLSGDRISPNEQIAPGHVPTSEKRKNLNLSVRFPVSHLPTIGLLSRSSVRAT